MINKEEIEKAKENISRSINDVFFSTLYSQEENEKDELTLLKYIRELENTNTQEKYMLKKRIKELEEINAEHQKLNGELQEKLTRAEEIIKGKCIQELGLSDLYKED